MVKIVFGFLGPKKKTSNLMLFWLKNENVKTKTIVSLKKFMNETQRLRLFSCT